MIAYRWHILMVQTRGGGNSNPGVGEGFSGGGARRNEDRAPTLPPPLPAPYNADVFFAQFLGSQRNMEQMQRNMEEALHNIADNTHRGDNQSGREVNQYSSFKDFVGSHYGGFYTANLD